LAKGLESQVEQRTKELRKAYEDLKVLDIAKSKFITMSSHQLRTPLSAIKGYISMLIEDSYGQIPEKAKEKLIAVSQSNERLIKIVNELLTISKIELGETELFKESAQIEDIIQSCYEKMETEAKKKNLKLIWQRPKKPLPKIEIDSFKIRQAILNLIDNALKYTKEGQIEIKAEKNNSTLQISVKDTGEGLTKEEQKNIFESFTRGEAGIAYWIEGAGLGLYMAKKYLELHQGKIWAESKDKGKGSTFYIELPIT
ncbi:MAG: HAMP domain-containing histidine kinase, partial [Candidatus Nealsonbacteria bacterium]|nr:HAMP domain-containing histidine kinase [Candidatus Nealsonbacteria bacterium]